MKSEKYSVDAEIVAICATLSRRRFSPTSPGVVRDLSRLKWPDQATFDAAVARAFAGGLVNRVCEDGSLCLSEAAEAANWAWLERSGSAQPDEEGE